MNGIEIARSFFFEWGEPWLQKKFPALSGRAAAGLFRGSQIYGADDGLSRDHGWGPMFLLILAEEDAAYCQQLSRALLAEAPREHNGYQFCSPEQNVVVISLENFFKQSLGFAHPPVNPATWQRANSSSNNARMRLEYELYQVRHGSIFYDPQGTFTARCEEFKYYPQIARLQRIWDELFSLWHFGQYNFVLRLSQRQDPVAALIGLSYFIESVMRLCLLLENDYTPYWKWLAFEFRKRPVAADFDPLLTELAETRSWERRVTIINEVCALIHGLVQKAGLSDEEDPYAYSPWLTYPLYCDQRSVLCLAHKEALRVYSEIEAGMTTNINEQIAIEK